MSGLKSPDGSSDRTGELIHRFRHDEPGARDELIEHVYHRFELLARRMLNKFRMLRREVETGDVLHESLGRLLQALRQVRPETPVHFLRLAATHIRWELLDLKRRYFGRRLKRDTSGRSMDDPGGPQHLLPETEGNEKRRSLSEWRDLDAAVEMLPDELKVVFELHFRQQLNQEVIAKLLQVDVRTVKRRWRAARLRLADLLGTRDTLGERAQ